VKREKPTRCN